MEEIPDWLKFLGGLGAILLLPTIGFVYSQGESNKVRENLAISNQELSDTMKGLASEINALSVKLGAEMVKIDYSEKRLNKMEDVVIYNSKQIAILKEKKGDEDG